MKKIFCLLLTLSLTISIIFNSYSLPIMHDLPIYDGNINVDIFGDESNKTEIPKQIATLIFDYGLYVCNSLTITYFDYNSIEKHEKNNKLQYPYVNVTFLKKDLDVLHNQKKFYAQMDIYDYLTSIGIEGVDIW